MSYVTIAAAGVAVVLLLMAGSHWLHPAPGAAASQPAAPARPAAALVVSTLAGHPPRPTYADGQGAEGRFWGVGPMAFDGHGNLYVAENAAVRKITPGGYMTTLAGEAPARQVLRNSSAMALNGDTSLSDGQRNGRGSAARFSGLAGIAVAPDGTVYVSDRESGAIRRITPGGRVSTFSSGRRTRFNPFSDEGHVSYSVAVAVGPDGAVYVLRGTLRKYLPSGREIELAGDPHEAGYADGRGTQARFNHPTGLAVDAQGNVFIADRGNHLIRRVSPQGEVTTVAGRGGRGWPTRVLRPR